jgi:hypothetical protein
MPLSEAEERVEHELRTMLMTVQIEQNRVATQRLQQEIKTENRKIVIQTVSSLAAAFAAGAAIFGLILHLTGKL